MEQVEEVVIVGAGIAGLSTSLGLHRLGIKSLVLESWDKLRTTGFAFTTWTNAWKALDALGIGDAVRQHHDRLTGIVATSAISGLATSEMSFTSNGKQEEEHEVRCVNRKILLEILEKELPVGTIRYSSKLVSIEDSGFFKLVHLADGTTIKAKVLIGCDGVNSLVSKWLGFETPAFVGRSAIRGYADFKRKHGFENKFLQFFGEGVRYGLLPCNEHTVYWFFTYSPSYPQDKKIEESSTEMKQFVLNNLGNVSDEVKSVIETTEVDSMICSPLRFRHPWQLLWGNISKGNVCVAGDGLHPMTPDLGQGACSSLEDGVVLARCLGEALRNKSSVEENNETEHKRIMIGLEKYAKERRWRSFELISTAYMIGFIQQSQGNVMTFLRDKVFAGFLAGLLLKRASFDCGKLEIS